MSRLLALEELVGEALLRLETVVLAARHGEGDADARLDVDVLAQRRQTVGVHQQRVVLHTSKPDLFFILL